MRHYGEIVGRVAGDRRIYVTGLVSRKDAEALSAPPYLCLGVLREHNRLSGIRVVG
jgi:hypothetical protein